MVVWCDMKAIKLCFLGLCVLPLTACSLFPWGEQTADEKQAVTTVVDGTVLTHDADVESPADLSPLAHPRYRSLYASAVMSRPGFDGNILMTINQNEVFFVLGVTGNNWLAVADRHNKLVGYIHKNIAREETDDVLASSHFPEKIVKSAVPSEQRKTTKARKTSTKTKSQRTSSASARQAKSKSPAKVQPKTQQVTAAKASAECVHLDNNSQACKEGHSNTWILE